MYDLLIGSKRNQPLGRSLVALDAAAVLGLAALQHSLSSSSSDAILRRCEIRSNEVAIEVASSPDLPMAVRQDLERCLLNLSAGYSIGLRDYRPGVSMQLATIEFDGDTLRMQFAGSHRVTVLLTLDGTAGDRSGGLAFTVADAVVDSPSQDVLRL